MSSTDLTTSPPVPVSDTSAGRRFDRYSFRGRARAVVFSDRPEVEPLECEVLTTDISRGGLSLLHRKQLVAGQQILLLLDGATRLVEVRWCCRAWAGLYAAGCAFVGVPDEGPVSIAAKSLLNGEPKPNGG